MNYNAYRKLNKKRRRLVRDLLLIEIKLSKQYSLELTQQANKMSAEEREYKRRVVSATRKTRIYCRNCPDADLKTAFLDMLTKGNGKILRINGEIIEVPYYDWRNKMLAVMAKGMGVWL